MLGLSVHQVARPWLVLSSRIGFLPIDRFLDVPGSWLFTLTWIADIHDTHGEDLLWYVEQPADGWWILTAAPVRTQSHRRSGYQHVLNRRAAIDFSFVSFPRDEFGGTRDDDRDRRIIVAVLRDGFAHRPHPFWFRDDYQFPRLYVARRRSGHPRLKQSDDLLTVNGLVFEISQNASSAKFGVERVLFVLVRRRSPPISIHCLKWWTAL